MKQTIKYLAMLMVMLSFGLTSTSCGDDDDEGGNLTVNNYFMECVSVTGGGLDNQDLAQLKNGFNEDVVDYYWKNKTKEEAIQYFDSQMLDLKEAFSNGSSIVKEGSLKIVFALKLQESGKVIKQTTLVITEKSSSLK
ncbi:MAG: hypothetical protein PUE90_04120 [Bacteroidales bacterium]|nr:hypothetical protein [Bacteroidales bacterium]